ncbi:uncharacterized protein LOC116249591 [Nymphaea colorata]|nr:uncharacterized protein LOC116249591 [Nymphaea colorata]
MYVTRPLSLYKDNPEALEIFPPEGPYSGYLLIQDAEGEEEARSSGSWLVGLFKDTTRCRTLPFPQDKLLKVEYTSGSGEDSHTVTNKTFFIPVLGQPLSSNLYYVVKAQGKNKGLVHTCSREEDVTTFCLCTCINDVKPIRFSSSNIYQQMKIIKRQNGGFKAESTVSDGFPPDFLRVKGWRVHTSDLPGKRKLAHVDGLNVCLRSKTPDFDFPMSQKSSSTVTVGEWYCPFLFIREIGGLKDPESQMKESLFYRMKLEQQWVEISNAENYHRSVYVPVRTSFSKEEALIGDGKYMVNESDVADGMLVLRGRNEFGTLVGVGLSQEIIEKMRNEQGGGRQEEDQVSVKRVFECENNGWTKFGCYVLEERYVLRRMDGTVVLTYIFKDPHQIKPKWE